MSKYHTILGVSLNATKDDINKAFRSLAKVYYPGVNKGIKEDEDKFKELSNARDKLLNGGLVYKQTFNGYDFTVDSEWFKKQNEWRKKKNEYKATEKLIKDKIKKIHRLWVFRICFWNSDHPILLLPLLFIIIYTTNLYFKIEDLELILFAIYVVYSSILRLITITKEIILRVKLLDMSEY